MGKIGYINKGGGLGHTKLNELYLEANARLKKVYDGLCPALWGGGTQINLAMGQMINIPFRLFERKFFFFDSVPVAPFTTVAEAFMGGLASLGNPPLPGWIPGDAAWFRRYDHTVFTDFVGYSEVVELSDSSLALDDAYGVCRILPPASWEVQQQLIWPLGNLNYETLKWSLEAHKKTVDGKDYFVFVNDAGGGNEMNDTEAQHIDMVNPIEVFLGRGVGASFEWPAHYNKYSFIRFHNLQTVPVALSMYTLEGNPDGSLGAVVPALGSLCVRRAEGINGWIVGTDYFFLASPGDPWFVNNPNEKNCNLTNWLLAGHQLPHLGDDYNTRSVLDAREWWDYGASGLAEVFGGAPTGETLLGDLLFHKGKLLKVKLNPETGETTKDWINFTGMMGLEAALTAAGITLTNNSANDPWGRGFDIVASGAQFELIDFSTNILHAGGGGGGWGQHGVLTIGDGVAPFTWLGLTVPNRLSCLGVMDVESSLTWANTVTWTNRVMVQRGSAESQLYRGYFDKLDWVLTDLLAELPEDNPVVPALSVKLTTHGPWLFGEEQIPGWAAGDFDYRGLTGMYPWDSYSPQNRLVWAPVVIEGDAMVRRFSGPLFQRDEMGSSVNYPPSADTYPAWAAYGGMEGLGSGAHAPTLLTPHWPRVDRRWTSKRYFIHQPSKAFDAEPFDTYHAYQTEERPFLKAYYESQPMVDWYGPRRRVNRFNGSQSPVPGQPAKKGVRFLDRFVPGAQDFYASLATWLRQGKMAVQVPNSAPFAGDVGKITHDFVAGGADQNNYYGTQQGSIQHAQPTTYDVDGVVNLLPTMTEHFNTIAGAVNGVVGATGGIYQPALLGAFLPVRATLGLGDRHVRPREEYASWDAVTWPDQQVVWEAQGVPVYSAADFPEDYGLLTSLNQNYKMWVWDAETETGAWLETETPPDYGGPYTIGSNWLPWMLDAENYRWVKIADVQALCARLGLPFKFGELAVPARIEIADGATTDIGPGPHSTTGWFGLNAAGLVVDAAGEWVFDCDASDGMGREILKASTARTDAWVAVLGPSNLVRVDWSPVDERLYYPGVRVAHWTWFGDGAQTISTQFQNGNRCYVYRNYGMPAATAVIWPRNYPDVETRDPGLFPAQRYPAYYTLVAKTEIERGAAFLVQDIAEDDETVISAADQEYAVMQVWPGVLKLD